ncbi:MAG TPA: L,D-transpeptidase family protein [Sphingomicrobium sp.]|nr:L,D-transpeptidase family protein [Sphingomicrobium sp.]
MRLSILLGAALAVAMPLSAAPAQGIFRGDEPIAVPRNIKQGIDFVYVDPQLSNIAKRHQRPVNWLLRTIGFDWATGRRNGPNPVFIDLAQGLRQYQMSWGRLPQIKVPAGPTLKRGSTGRRVELLRMRLGLPAAGGYDERLEENVNAYQLIHGLGSDGIAGRATIGSLNRGANYYLRKIAINMERAHRLPPRDRFDRYIVVDSGAAEAYLFVHDRVADGMRVVVGSPKTKTPMMAVIMRDALANPYWNVPPELIRSLTARRIGEDGLSYLKNFHYQVLSDWSANGHIIDPDTVNWKAIASGKKQPTIRVRQLPGPWNSMGEMKFEMPNDYGIYLHDTPHKELFDDKYRWVSNGCVRLEDYKRFATWVFGGVPQPSGPTEQRFELPQPVPVFMTYMTVLARGNGVVFRPDPYGFDDLAMQQMFGPGRELASVE